jgi:ubiquitin C-terminal hydrolase
LLCTTQDLTTKGFRWEGYDGRVQHDVHELSRLLIDALERALVKTKGSSLVPALYKGLLVNQVQCLHCGTRSDRPESFYDVLLQVEPKVESDLAMALMRYTKPEKLAGDNQYYCDKCDAKKNAVRSQLLRRLPPVLIFSLNRFEFDMKTYERVKVCV